MSEANNYCLASAAPSNIVLLIGLVGSLFLMGCQGPASRGANQQTDSAPTRIPAGILQRPDPVPRDEPLSASGNSRSYVVFGERYFRLNSARGFDQTGVASWYGRKFHGRLTASGEPYDMFAMTAAHKSLPLPTFARVTNLENNKSIVVRINDRGPFVDDRLIDLSYTAAAKLDMLAAGTAKVRVVTLSGVPGKAPAAPVIAMPSQPEPIDPSILALTSTAPKPQFPIDYATKPEPAATDSSSRPQQVALLEGNYLQLGAFGSFEAAGAMRERVAEISGADVFIAKQSDSGLYRVQVGPFDSDALLGAARRRLWQEHAIDAIPVQHSEAVPPCC